MVDFGGGSVPADLNGYLPAINESVWILRINGTLTIMGPSTMKPDQGTVFTSPSGDRVTVSTVAGNVSCVYSSGLVLSSGQDVKLLWQGNEPFVIAVMSTTPPPPTPPPAPDPGPVSSGSQVFMAEGSGSFRISDGALISGQVNAADSSVGMWTHNTKIPGTIPGGVSTKTLEIYISIARIIVNAPINFAPHTRASIGEGMPSFGPSFGAAADNPNKTPPGTGWYALDPALGNYLNAGGGGFRSIGLNHGGYWVLNDLATDPQSGAIRITW